MSESACQAVSCAERASWVHLCHSVTPEFSWYESPLVARYYCARHSELLALWCARRYEIARGPDANFEALDAGLRATYHAMTEEDDVD